jgi:hypothetical protein
MLKIRYFGRPPVLFIIMGVKNENQIQRIYDNFPHYKDLYEILEYIPRKHNIPTKILVKEMFTGIIVETEYYNFLKGQIPREFFKSIAINKVYDKFPHYKNLYEVIEYIPGGYSKPPNILVKELSTGIIVKAQYQNFLNGSIPRKFEIHNHPRNEIPHHIYLCLVSKYSNQTCGPFLTVGITKHSPRQRYGNCLLNTLCLTEKRLNAHNDEQSLIKKMSKHFGPPTVGYEAWPVKDVSINKAISIFNLTQCHNPHHNSK